MDNYLDFEKRICQDCGKENENSAKFCMECGARLTPNKCPNCKSEVAQGAKFCTLCGCNLQKSQEPKIYKEPKPQQKMKRLTKAEVKESRAYAIIKSSLFLLISALVLLFSFLPILTFEFDDEFGFDRDNTIKVSFTPIENTMFLFDSIIENDEEDMELDSFYDKYEDALDEVKEIKNSNGLSAKDKKAITKFAKLTVRLGLRSDSISLSPQFIVLALFSVLYMAFALTFFGMSLCQFIRTLMNRVPNYKLLQSALCLAPFVIIFTYLISKGDYISTTMACGTPSLIICLVGIVLVALDGYILHGNRLSLKKALTFGLCLCFLVASMFLAFGSAYGVEITESRSAKTEFSTVYFQEFELNDNMLEELSKSTSDDIKNGVNSITETFSIKDIRDGDANMSISLVMSLAVYNWLEDSCVALSAIYYVAMLAGLLFAIAGFMVTASLCNGTRVVKAIWALVIIAILLTIAYLVLDIVFIEMVDSIFYKYYLETIIDVQIVAVPIILTIFSVLSLVALILSKVLEGIKPKKSIEQNNAASITLQ